MNSHFLSSLNRMDTQADVGAPVNHRFRMPIKCMPAVITTALIPLMQQGTQINNKYMYNHHIIYLCAELVRMVAMSCMARNEHSTGSILYTRLRSYEPTSFMMVFVLFVHNNLSFVVLLHFKASSFLLLMNLRLVAVELFSVLVLRKSMGRIQCYTLILLCVGSVQHYWSLSLTPYYLTHLEGGASMIIMAACSALISICNEQRGLEQRHEQHRMARNFSPHAYGVLLNAVNWAHSIWGGADPVGQVNLVVILLVLGTSIHLFYIPIIFKEFGAVTQCVVSAIAIAVTDVTEFALWDSRPSGLTGSSFSVILTSALAHSLIREREISQIGALDVQGASSDIQDCHCINRNKAVLR